MDDNTAWVVGMITSLLVVGMIILGSLKLHCDFQEKMASLGYNQVQDISTTYHWAK